MSQLDSISRRPIRHLAYITVVVAIFLPGFISCSAEVPQDVPEQAATPEAVSPFSRLADPGGCVIEQITMADHDEYQVQGASADGKMLSMTASLEGPAENDSIYQVYEMDLVTGEKTHLPDILKNSGAFSPVRKIHRDATASHRGPRLRRPRAVFA